jgi:phospholipase/carboxylesterase
MPRFFRRLAEGVFDQEDLARRTDDLAAWLEAAASACAFDADRVFAVGFSNGANIAASLLLRRPGRLAGAALLRAMVPFEPAPGAGLTGTEVLMLSGEHDPIVPVANTRRLAAILEERGANVLLQLRPAGHQLDRGDIDALREWLAPAIAES